MFCSATYGLASGGQLSTSNAEITSQTLPLFPLAKQRTPSLIHGELSTSNIQETTPHALGEHVCCGAPLGEFAFSLFCVLCCVRLSVRWPPQHFKVDVPSQTLPVVPSAEENVFSLER